ncbi:MAG: PAS domain S-box protein [Dongiaceae bacterium]
MATVLIVDDQDAVRMTLRDALERAGFQVQEARDGADAICIHRGNPLLEYDLGGRNGQIVDSVGEESRWVRPAPAFERPGKDKTMSHDAPGVRRQDVLLFAILVLITIGVFLLDSLIAPGVSAGMLYLAVVFLAAWSRWRYGIVFFATTGTVLIVLGYIVSPPGGVARMVLADRGLHLFAIWMTAVVLLQRRKTKEAIEAVRNGLEARVKERTTDLEKSNAELAAQIAEREQSEAILREHRARLQGIMDSAGDGIITIDERGIIDSFNHAAELVFGYAAEQVCGRDVGFLMPAPHRGRHNGYIEDYLRTGKARIIGIAPREVPALRKDGSTFPMELAVTEMKSEGKRRFIGVLRDITRKKETEKQLRQAQKMESVGQLTGGVAHDFNNLLTVIMGSLEMAEGRAGEDPRLRSALGSAMTAAGQAADLIRQLMAFARQQPLQPQALDLDRVVAGMTPMLRRTLGEHIEIEVNPSAGLHLATADRTQLENALLNLAINARDAMSQGGKLTLETANVHLDSGYAARNAEVTPGDYAMLAISDSGVGMPPEVIERAFEPFFTTKGPGKGTGLGLSMVYGFVKQSGGHLKIYSEVGHGTTMRLYLPNATALEASAEAQPLGAGLPRGDETVLVVEDDTAVRELVVSQLAGLGYAVLQAPDGPAAEAVLEGGAAVDLLFTDIVMPGGMTGRQLADRARRRRPGLKVLFTSGYAENAVVHQGRLDPGVHLLSKPYKKLDLARKIRQVLDSLADG